MTERAQENNGVHRGALFAAACAGLALFGITIVLLGTIFRDEAFAASLGQVLPDGKVNIAGLGRLAALLLSGVWLAKLALGPVIDRFGNKFVLAGSSFLVAIALVMFALTDSFDVAGVVCFVLGFGGGGLNISTNTLVSALYETRRGAMLNYLGLFFSVGALLLTVVAASKALSSTGLMWASAVLGFAVGVAYLVLRFPRPAEEHRFSIRESVKVIMYPGVLVLSLLLLFQTANEQAIVTFTPQWLGAVGASEAMSKLGVSVYQIGMLSGRLFAGRVLHNARKENVVLVTSVLATGCAVLMWQADSPTLKFMSAILIGLSFGPIYPTVLAIAGDRYQRFAGSVFGVLLAVALLGGIIAPEAIGHISNEQKTAGAIVPVIGIIAVAVLALISRGGRSQVRA